MTVPPDPNAPDSGDREPAPDDVAPPEPAAGATYGQDSPAGFGPGSAAGYGQGAAAGYGQGDWPGYGQGPYDPPAGGTAQLWSGPAPVLVSFAPAGRQRRFDTWLRIILVIPHLVVLWALLIAAEVVVFISWFAALFTGEMPAWAHPFVTGTLRWQTRVYGYLFLLTDRYPPFSLEDEAYPVRLATARTKLNRFAVLFRLLLVIPAGIVAAVATEGLLIASFFIWLIALITGRVPAAAHSAVGSVIRYQARYYGYFFMVTGEYPKGLYGDQVPSDGETEPGTDPWRLTLSPGAKPLLTVFLVLGVALLVVNFVVPIATGGGNPGAALSNAAGLIQIGAAYDKLTSSTIGFENATQACGGKLACVTSQDRKEAGYVQTFAGAVRSAGLHGQPATDASTLIRDADRSAQSLDTLATATSVSQYESDFSTTGLQQQLNNVDSDYRKLIQDLAPNG
jgi:Domain of unknown function (DUF4389)